jgi:hypothetical protein
MPASETFDVQDSDVILVIYFTVADDYHNMVSIERGWFQQHAKKKLTEM